MSKISNKQVKHIADLAQLQIDDAQTEDITEAFVETLAVVDQLKAVDTAQVEPTSQVTGMENVWREDEVDQEKMLSQTEALANAKKTYQGLFVVPRLIDNGE